MSHRGLEGVSFVPRTGTVIKEDIFNDGSRRLYILDEDGAEFTTGAPDMGVRAGHTMTVVVAKSPPTVTTDDWHVGYYNHDLNAWQVPQVRLSNYIQQFRTSNGCMVSLLSFAAGLVAIGVGFASFTIPLLGPIIGLALVALAVYLMLFVPLSRSAGVTRKSKQLTEDIPRRAREALDAHLSARGAQRTQS